MDFSFSNIWGGFEITSRVKPNSTQAPKYHDLHSGFTLDPWTFGQMEKHRKVTLKYWGCKGKTRAVISDGCRVQLPDMSWTIGHCTWDAKSAKVYSKQWKRGRVKRVVVKIPTLAEKQNLCVWWLMHSDAYMGAQWALLIIMNLTSLSCLVGTFSIFRLRICTGGLPRREGSCIDLKSYYQRVRLLLMFKHIAPNPC